MSDVDKGNTVLDYMQLEQERGITINAAAISFDWLKHRINLIDTPGRIPILKGTSYSCSSFFGYH